MSDSIEIEYKYRADKIKLQDFINLVKNLNPLKRKDASSWDFYFTKDSNPDDFIRYRESDNPELTIKRKTNTSNSWERVEIDLPLDKDRISKEIVENWAGLENYKQNFSIYKTCVIFWLEKVNLVYYLTYDSNMKELDRFIEIEVNKDYVTKVGSEKAFLELLEVERKLEPIGITYNNRLKRSLFDIYRK